MCGPELVVKVLVVQSHLPLCDSVDCSLPSSSVHGILPAILEWIVIPSPGDLPVLGIDPRSPVLQADSLPSEPPGSDHCVNSSKRDTKISCPPSRPLWVLTNTMPLPYKNTDIWMEISGKAKVKFFQPFPVCPPSFKPMICRKRLHLPCYYISSQSSFLFSGCFKWQWQCNIKSNH